MCIRIIYLGLMVSMLIREKQELHLYNVSYQSPLNSEISVGFIGVIR